MQRFEYMAQSPSEDIPVISQSTWPSEKLTLGTGLKALWTLDIVMRCE